MESFSQEKLFGALLGFREGDRVKVRRKVREWRQGRPSTFHYYWKYGTVVGVVKVRNWLLEVDEERIAVDFEGFPYHLKPQDLIRCRKYVSKNQ